MTSNAQWRVQGVNEKGGYEGMYLCSPDLQNVKEAKRRAVKEAKRRWLKKGLKVRVVTVECVG